MTDGDADAVRWTTCAELAKVRGISAASAIYLAFPTGIAPLTVAMTRLLGWPSRSEGEM